MSSNTLPDNNTKINVKTFLLDPLSVIIKLAILSKKPTGTKIFIQNNILYLQEPGPFQSFCRILFNTNKTDLQYMYNPIQLACQNFLSKEFIQKTPRMKNLFVCAQDGLKKLMETYNTCNIIVLSLNYYYTIISNHVEQIYNDSIFQRDNMTALYTKELVSELISKWKDEKIKIVLDIIGFLKTDSMAASNVKSLENIMDNIDKDSYETLKKY
jgi:hypothetical protein